MFQIRNLNAGEIEVRAGSISERGAVLLLYKNARVDQTILDESFGIYGWKRSHQMIGEDLYCTVSIWDSEKKRMDIQAGCRSRELFREGEREGIRQL